MRNAGQELLTWMSHKKWWFWIGIVDWSCDPDAFLRFSSVGKEPAHDVEILLEDNGEFQCYSRPVDRRSAPPGADPLREDCVRRRRIVGLGACCHVLGGM